MIKRKRGKRRASEKEGVMGQLIYFAHARSIFANTNIKDADRESRYCIYCAEAHKSNTILSLCLSSLFSSTKPRTLTDRVGSSALRFVTIFSRAREIVRRGT